jgi:hypothetical protein
MEDAIKKTVCGLLDLCQMLRYITAGFEDVGIEIRSFIWMHDQISDMIWSLYDITLTPEQSSENFHRIIIDFSNEEFNTDECLERLALFATNPN